MSRDSERQKQFTRRALVLGGAQASLIAVLGGRLYYLQVVEADRYATLAEENRINLRLLPPPRGRILDRQRRPLAINRQDYRAVIVAEQAGDLETTLGRLDRIVALSEGDIARITREIRRKRRFVPVSVKEGLPWEDVARIEANALDLPGISIEEGQTRYYPYKDILAHVLGYVAPVAEGEATGDPLLELPDFRIGKAGVEKVYDLPLRGTGGRSQVEVNAVGRIIRELERHEGRPGQDVALKIDLDLQQYAYQRLGDDSGAAVVIDVLTGDVLALASSPAYDPNAFSRGLSVAEWRALLGNEKAPLTNKATAGQYAPGSTFKPVVALAGLEKGVITASTAFFCPGKLRLGNTDFHCWRRGGHGHVVLNTALAQSCDVFFYETARRVGIEAIHDMALRLGFGEKLGIDLPHERPGLIPSKEWKQAKLGRPWLVGETLIAGIGQGYVLSTPLQLAVMTARIANGEYAVRPRLGPGIASVDGDIAQLDLQPLDISPEHLRLVREGMNAVVNRPGGTARRAAIHEPGWEMAGKTGTSQVRRITRAERLAGVRRNEDLPWRRRDHALFIGFAPVHAPRYAAAVIVEHGGSGSKAAAPIASDILRTAQELDAVRAVPLADSTLQTPPLAGGTGRRQG